jgi:hypothetical protein
MHSPYLGDAVKELLRRKMEAGGFQFPSHPKQLSEAIRPVRSRLVRVRIALVLVSLIMEIICAFSFLFQRNIYTLFLGFLCVAAGASLLLVVLVELHKGAGRHIERQFERDKEYFRTYEFISSINTFRSLFSIIAVSYASILVGYATAYSAITATHVGAFSSECSSLSDALYFALVTFATVGYGDITPISPIARIVVSSEIVLSICVNVVLLAAIISWVTGRAMQRHEQEINTRNREVQERESLIKELKLGLYGNKDEIIKEVMDIVTEFEKKQPS